MMSWTTLLLTAGALACAEPATDFGYLWQPAFALDTARRGPAAAYVPQVGDIVIFNSEDVLWRLSYLLALSGPPTHCGVIVRNCDGALRLLEAGPRSTLRVELSSVPTRLHEYRGDVYVRRRTAPFTNEQTRQLTDFALAVDQKLVPPIRFVAQVTPLRMRGPIRTACIGGPRGVRRGYICSELVVEACVAAGVMDAKTARPAATYPRDLFFDHSPNCYLNQHLHLCPDWAPPALWTPCP